MQQRVKAGLCLRKMGRRIANSPNKWQLGEGHAKPRLKKAKFQKAERELAEQ